MSNYRIEFEGRVFEPNGKVEATPESVDETNRRTSEQEVAAFKARCFDRKFAYWRNAKNPSHWQMGDDGPCIVTWTGEILAHVFWTGDEYRCPAFGHWPSTRMNFCARGIDGRRWSGTYYKSSGDYVRMRVVK